MEFKNYKTLFILFLFLTLIIFSTKLKTNEIVQDRNGNYFLIKKDGTYKKLPPPKPGFKYILKKKKYIKAVKEKKEKNWYSNSKNSKSKRSKRL